MASWNLGMFLLVVVLTSLSLRNSARAQTYTVLHNFSSATGTGPEFAVLAQGRDGNLYGTTTQGGLNNVGVVFRSTPTGAYTVRYNFDVTHGSTPFGGLTLGVDGNFYGTTEIGGTSNDGTVFKISPSGLLTTLFNFDYANDDGTALPYAAPIQGADGNFYGTTYYARAYKLMPTGQMDVIQTSGSSYAPMVQGVDGKFYGATSNGGNSLNGSIFSVNATNGLYSDIYSFAGNSSGNASGPYGGLVQDSDGNFYGTTPWGGSLGGGTIFQVSATGNFTELHEFSTDTSGNSCGSTAGLVYASDGNFYGVTGGCGTLGYGVVFKFTPSSRAYTVLYNFDKTHGWGNISTPMQHTNGKLYGLTSNGGTGDSGVLYTVDLGLKPFAKLSPAIGHSGQMIGILGQGLIGTTSVTFNGKPSTFKVVSNTYLRATVPSGATTGVVTITTPKGTMTSNQAFVIQ